MSYRPLAVVAAVTTLSLMQIANAAAQSVYVAPGGIYIGAGAGPVYVNSGAPINGGYGYGAAAYVDPGYGYDYGYAAAAYVEPGYDYGYGVAAYTQPDCYGGYGAAPYEQASYGYYGYGPGAYVPPRYGYGYGARPYIAPRFGYGYGPAVPHRRYYTGPRSAYAPALRPRPPLAIPYRAARLIRR